MDDNVIRLPGMSLDTSRVVWLRSDAHPAVRDVVGIGPFRILSTSLLELGGEADRIALLHTGKEISVSYLTNERPQQ